ncbi:MULTISPECIES: enoyl-CoA hydratase/isomerase family protein [unclassified Paludibacterium]|uniref:enoyl-CoA hydratase/isomerase family protein n=1 Tax=unclassified Paludibacterium TaxID=2618429 RepID=UPI00207B3791|nr:enoyl-CoA hydratase/isomerase family protein [Paludibacterium sp. B53371]BEV70629.1 enoyl-CoA hydratase/isomerase family protein [Paludibacterium sp. THUN1379]
MSDTLQLERRGNQAWIWLSRPEVHNAFNPALILELTDTLANLQNQPEVRVIVLASQGKSFCAGADLNWMKSAGELGDAENLADAQRLARLFRTLYRSNKPVIARIQGAALGGGMGLVAACDIAVCTPAARFALSEVRLGLIPAVIGPYVAEAIGVRQARRYALTAETLDAARALKLGLVHEVVEDSALDSTVSHLAEHIVRGGPEALSQAKALLRNLIEGGPGDDEVLDDCARRIAMLRRGPEAREGLQAFLDKRPPHWQGESA